MAGKKDKSEKGVSLEDAFADDDDVEYAKSKPAKIKKSDRKEKNVTESNYDDSKPAIKSSKPISQIKKGDKIKADSLILEVDSHYVLMDHKTTKEMTIELFDRKTDKDYQIRYFSDNVENSIQFFELDEIIYNEIPVKKIEW